MTLFERFQEAAAPIRERILAHPFVRGLGDGTLTGDRKREHAAILDQKAVVLAQVELVSVARADDLAVASRLADVLNATVNTEMDLHREACWTAGISPEALEDTVPAPATAAYTNHLRVAAETGDLPAILAAILPCAHGYYDIASHLRASGLPEGQPLYANWIRMYTSDEYAAMAKWMAGLLDRIGEDVPPSREAALRDVYLASERYEYLFWDAAWRMEGWPL